MNIVIARVDVGIVVVDNGLAGYNVDNFDVDSGLTNYNFDIFDVAKGLTIYKGIFDVVGGADDRLPV